MEKRPTLLYERSHIKKHMNLFGYAMTPDEITWFDQNYEVVKEFQSNNTPSVHSARLGPDDEFAEVFRRRTDLPLSASKLPTRGWEHEPFAPAIAPGHFFAAVKIIS